MNVVLLLLKLAGLSTLFIETLTVYSTAWQNAMTFVPSTKSKEDYSWLGDVSQMEEWKDELVPSGLAEFDYTLKNKRFGSALTFFNDDLSDELYGQSKLRVSDLAEKAKAYPTVLLRSLRTDGTTNLCYDGQPFFSTTHSEGDSGAQSNLHTGTGTTEAQIQADFESARGLMLSYKTDKGDPWTRENPKFVAVCSPTLDVKLRKALMLGTVSTGGQNVYAGMVSDVEVDQGLTGNDWYLEDRSPKVKAYILQEREVVTPANTMPGSDKHILEDKIFFRVKWRGNAGYGQWRHAVKINN